MSEVLGMSKDGSYTGDVQIDENPISILTSIFVLNIASIQGLPESLISTEAKSTGSGDMNFDQLLKIVFKITFWICSDSNSFFSDQQRVTLLKLAMSNLQLITRHCTPQANLELMSDKTSVQTFLLELICLNDGALMEMFSFYHRPILMRLEQDIKSNKASSKEAITPKLKDIFVQILEKSQEIL